MTTRSGLGGVKHSDNGIRLALREQDNQLDCVHFIDQSYVYASRRNMVLRRRLGAPPGEPFVHLATLQPRRALDHLLLRTKTTRRVFRRRVENIAVLSTGTVIALLDGRIFRIPPGGAPEVVHDIERCRGTLHRGIAVLPNDVLLFGEYLRNAERIAVRMLRGYDDGRRWEVCYESAPGKFRHYHGCFWDPYEQTVWFSTGDIEGENWIVRTDPEFRNVEYIGDGSKPYSSVNLVFTKDYVYFGNDNHLGLNYLNRLDRKTWGIQPLEAINGPAWYGCTTSDGWIVFASTVETCPALDDLRVHMYVSKDGERWHDIAQWNKDPLRPWDAFQFGVINFPGGQPQPSSDVWFSGQALSRLNLAVARGGIIGDARA